MSTWTQQQWLAADLDGPAQRTVRAFVRDGELVGLPAKRSRRRVLLERLCTAFSPGVRYPEAEVDARLDARSAGVPRGGPDHATLRRYLVEEGLLSRGDGYYWRSGGPVEHV